MLHTTLTMQNDALTPNIQIENDFIVAHKPYGLNTHSQDQNEWGFVEWLSKKINQNLFVFQRLDQTTSGVILFARSKESANFLTNQWKERAPQKKYLFITDKKIKQTNIKQNGGSKFNGDRIVCRINIDDKEALTEFEFNKEYKTYCLWAAYPKTGRPHQIRKHAQATGIPILGDTLYGGSNFFRICLHAESLTLPWLHEKKYNAPASLFFHQLEMLDQVPLCQMIDAVHQRLAVYKIDSIKKCESFRWIHTDGPNIRMDQFGSQFWFYDYNSKMDLSLIESFLKKIHLINSIPISTKGFVRSMKNRGTLNSSVVETNIPELVKLEVAKSDYLKSDYTKSDLANSDFENLESSDYCQTSDVWNCDENGVHYELRSHSGMSPGLFLDQRANRKWVRNNSKDKTVLNLFSYTGGFSVNAALGGASKVTTVDLSSNFIEWTKRNFELNQIPLSPHEFWTADVLTYLKGGLKRNNKFDFIICDPPSFGRNKKNIFRIEDEIDNLVGMLMDLLNPEGKILFSTNYEKWSSMDFLKRLNKASQKKYLSQPHSKTSWPSSSWQPSIYPDLDFERHSSNRLMKSFVFGSH